MPRNFKEQGIVMKSMSAIPVKRIVFATSLMMMTFILLKYMSYSENVPPKKQFSTFPEQIGEWHGTISHFDQSIYDELGVDDSILISYSGLDKKQIQVYVGYYQSQKEGSVIHSPKNCMPGSGWEITSTITEEVKIPGSTINLIRLVIKKGLDEQIVLYWFQERGRYISSEYWQKIYLVWDAIFHKRTDGSFVRLIAPVDSRGEKYTIDFLKSFASELIPILNQYIPGETR
jgi:EpsI family protein